MNKNDPVFWIRPGSFQFELRFSWRFYTGQYYLYWGDSSVRELVQGASSVSHIYPKPGAYMLRTADSSSRWLEDAQVVIPPQWKVPVEFGPDPDHPDLYAVRALDPGTGVAHKLRVNWRDGAPDEIQEQWCAGGEVFRRYLAPGTHIVSTYDLSTTAQFHYRDVEVSHDRDPDFTAEVTGREVAVTVTKNSGGGALGISWGDLTLPEPVTGTTATHTFPAAAVNTTYLVQLYRADGSSSTTHPVTIPGGAA